MEENNKRRIRLSDNSALVWQQRRAAEEKNVHSNIVKNDNILYRTARAAKEAEDRMYAEKAEQNRASKEMPAAEKQRRMELRHVEEGLEVRNNMIRQERKLGGEGLVSEEEMRHAQNSGRYVGRKDPMKVKKRDVRGLEGKTKRLKRASERLLPSERKSRLSRAKIERNRKRTLERTARKELYITDSKGQKISVDRLRKLRGLDKATTSSRRNSFSKNQQIIKRREQEAARAAQLRIRKRDEYTR